MAATAINRIRAVNKVLGIAGSISSRDMQGKGGFQQLLPALGETKAARLGALCTQA
jgi:hypothetical protein